MTTTCSRVLYTDTCCIFTLFTYYTYVLAYIIVVFFRIFYRKLVLVVVLRRFFFTRRSPIFNLLDIFFFLCVSEFLPRDTT